MVQIEIDPNTEKKYIPSKYFDVCLIDGITRKEITNLFPSRSDGAYFLDKFSNYLQKYSLTLRDYCIQHLGINWPKCPVTDVLVGYKITGIGIIFSKFKLGKQCAKYSERVAKSSQKMSETRRGKGNPMFGKDPWNKDISPDHPWTVALVKRLTGNIPSEETRKKMRDAREKSPIKARHTTPHSPETIEKLRMSTASLYTDGTFDRKTKIHIKIGEILRSILSEEEIFEEHLFGYYAIDFALPRWKIGIEADGDYYHVNPIKYPDGPTGRYPKKESQTRQSERLVL